MIVRTLEEICGTDKDVEAENWTSRRFLLKRDGMGFSLHDTVIKPGTETYIWYANHLEAVYCIAGEGEVEVIETGEVFAIRRSEEHTSELQSLMRISYAVFCLKKKTKTLHNRSTQLFNIHSPLILN